MSTHFLSASNSILPIQTYRIPSLNGQRSFIYPIETEITLIEENVGIRCDFGFISSSFGQSYVETKYIAPLEGTGKSAPYVCKFSLQTEAYVEPTWYLEPINKPYLNQRTLEYEIPIITSYLNLNQINELNNEIKTKGLKKLLKYYNKYFTEEDLPPFNPLDIEKIALLQDCLDYYIFAEVKDIYVPYRPNARIRGLLSVKQKYFDALPVNNTNQTSAPFDLDISNANFICRIPLQELETYFKSLSNILKIYNTDVYLSNSTLGFKFGGGDTGMYNTSDKLMDQLSLYDRAEKIERFYNSLLELLSINGFEISENKNEINKAYVEIAINDKCNKIYDVGVNKNNRCTKLRVGIERFLTIDPMDDPTIVAFVKNIDIITKIEKCKVPWPEFVETYVYPRTIVRNVSINDVAQGLELDLMQYVKDLFQIYNSIVAEGQFAPGRTFEETVKDELGVAFFKGFYAWEAVKGKLFVKDLFKADNFFSKAAIKKFFIDIEGAAEPSPQPEKKIIVALNAGTGNYQPVKGYQQGYRFELVNTTSYELNELKLLDASKPTAPIYDGTGAPAGELAIYSYKKDPNAAARKEEYFLNKIYDKLNAVGLCRIIDFTLKCLANIAREFVEIEASATVTYGALNSLSSKELTSNAIKYLPKEQQELVYSKLLMETSCVNSVALLYILKKVLPPEQYTMLNLETAEYENIVNEVSKLMSTSPQ